MRRWGVTDKRLEFADFYAAARDDCLQIVLVTVGDRQLAEDLVAEAFTRAWASWRVVRGHPAPRAWVVRTALNLSVSWWRRRKREVALGDSDLVAPGGLLFSATLNRTLRARALAVFAAENILRWLPRGTHDWNKFLTPDELKALVSRGGLKVIDETGVVFHALAGEWRPSPDMGINYMVLAERSR